MYRTAIAPSPLNQAIQISLAAESEQSHQGHGLLNFGKPGQQRRHGPTLILDLPCGSSVSYGGCPACCSARSVRSLRLLTISSTYLSKNSSPSL